MQCLILGGGGLILFKKNQFYYTEIADLYLKTTEREIRYLHKHSSFLFLFLIFHVHAVFESSRITKWVSSGSEK